jgi:hypothetical protein
MSRWTHSICQDCWDKKNPDRQAFRLASVGHDEEKCCYCGKPHTSGIYVREDPAQVPCGGHAPEMAG